jgi:hypothetical protein
MPRVQTPPVSLPTPSRDKTHPRVRCPFVRTGPKTTGQHEAIPIGQRRRLAHKQLPPELGSDLGGQPSQADYKHLGVVARPMTVAALGKGVPSSRLLIILSREDPALGTAKRERRNVIGTNLPTCRGDGAFLNSILYCCRKSYKGLESDCLARPRRDWGAGADPACTPRAIGNNTRYISLKEVT